MVPALRRQRRVELSEFKVNLIYKVSFRTTRAAQRKTVSKEPK